MLASPLKSVKMLFVQDKTPDGEVEILSWTPDCGKPPTRFDTTRGIAKLVFCSTVCASPETLVRPGIAPKILPLLKEGNFMAAFLAKGRFEKYLSEIPVKVVIDETAPLLGAAQYAVGNIY